MSWAIMLPGAIAYFAAIRYSQNNVAAEASPITLAAAIRNEPRMAGASDVRVTLADGRSAPLLDLDCWQLLNVAIDDVIAHALRLHAECVITSNAIKAALDK